MIVDSHCHLDYPNIYDKLDEVINRANNSKVTRLLTICTTLESFSKIIIIVDKYKNVNGTFGIHPHETTNHQEVNSSYITNIVKKNKKIIGIGETGLDFYYNHSDKITQKKSFAEHIEAASQLDIPVIVHSRNAEDSTYEMIKSESRNIKVKFLIHCFTGTKEFAFKLLDLGSYISASGIVTFKKSIDLANTFKELPNDRILVETDSPFLAPVPLRGKENEPSYIIHTVKFLASIKNLSFENFSSITTKNFFNLFGNLS